MRKTGFRALLTIGIALLCTHVNAQERDDRATILNFKGIQFTSKDSLFYTNFRFRMQNRVKYTNTLDGEKNDEWEARVRRLRMRVDGYIYTPKISYSVQLAFTRGDQDFDDSGIPNIVRDAVIFYNFSDDFYIGFGQNKLPGNRQRVNSSGQLQFAERSIVNANFSIDRDFGISANLSKKIGDMPFNLKAEISTGEGRAVNTTDNGLAYTGRVEFLPFGQFTNSGDYSEGDLEREETPKLSIGGGYSFNNKTTRLSGQTGAFVKDAKDLSTLFADAIFKYNGFAYQVEYMKRNVDNPFNQDLEGKEVYVYKGYGINQQISYLFSKGYELAGRYTFVDPHKDIRPKEERTEILEAGLTKYMKAHRLKFQLNGNYLVKDGYYNNKMDDNKWGFTFQVELGI
ncbi:porin [Sphingobacterium spiritivorum]|uniref:porin n=1 Tax=Sphingobacterium spiritivorum TaxID=258 RepID=UPI003DA4A59C